MPHLLEPSATGHVLTAHRGDLLLAFPVAGIGRTLTLPASPRIPGTVSWLGGAVRLDHHLLWLLDPLAADSTPDQCLVLIAAGADPRWAVRIDRVGSLVEIVPEVRPAATAWPAAWGSGCRLSDGRSAWLVAPHALDRAVA
jgi:hypothetical protein